jgi:two-component system chemotaxis response regulator CheB
VNVASRPLVAAPPVRVLVIDDSVVARRVVAHAIDAEPGLVLAGTAPNGKAAIDKLDLLRPDVLVLDLDMPVMNGFETLATVKRSHPDLPVIVFSHLTRAGAAATLDALALGATGFALKPRADGIGMAEELVRAELLPLILAVANRPADVVIPMAHGPAPLAHQTQFERSPVTAVVIGVSTGGPNALAELMPSLPANLTVPVFIVQHMPAVFTQMLAERLDRVADVQVKEAAASEPIVAGRVYVAPGGRHMAVRGTATFAEIELTDDVPENSCRPSADVLFRSAARVYGSGVAGVVLTGMGSDGLHGCAAVRAAGGAVMVQDARTSVVASMPCAVADAGLANAVLPLQEVGPTLVRWITGAR